MVAACIALLATTGGGVVVLMGLLARRGGVMRTKLKQRVIVTCKSGDSFLGVLFAEDASALVLRDASALGAGQGKTDVPLDGEIVVLLADVAYLQRP